MKNITPLPANVAGWFTCTPVQWDGIVGENSDSFARAMVRGMSKPTDQTWLTFLRLLRPAFCNEDVQHTVSQVITLISIAPPLLPRWYTCALVTCFGVHHHARSVRRALCFSDVFRGAFRSTVEPSGAPQVLPRPRNFTEAYSP